MTAAPVLDEPTEAPASTRNQRRSRRKRAVSARTISMKRLARRELEMGAILQPEDLLTEALRAERPRTRGECQDGPRPCPWVSCRHHLALEVLAKTGAVRHNFPDVEVEDMSESCALDVADRGAVSLDAVAELLAFTAERVRQVQGVAMAKVRRTLPVL